MTAVGSAVGVSVAQSLRRRVSTEDPYEGEDFELLDDDRSVVVTTPDGVPLAVREVGPKDAPLTVVFAHGFCLRMGAFYFQRARLTEQWGSQVRMVFYDQRGHGQSGEAPPEYVHGGAARQGSGDGAGGDGAARPRGSGRAIRWAA